MFDEKINVAEIMQQIKDEVSQRYHTGNSPSFPVYDADYPAAKTLDEIDQLTRTIRQNRETLRDLRNIGAVVPAYSRFPALLRPFLRFFSKLLRKGIQFVMQDQVDVNSQITAIFDAMKPLHGMDEKERLMLSQSYASSAKQTKPGPGPENEGAEE